MSKAYSQHKVNELKELLRERSLPLNGTKSELIARLEENDTLSVDESKSEQQEPAEKAAEPESNTPSEPVEEDLAEVGEVPAQEETAAQDESLAQDEIPLEPAAPVLSDEELLTKIKADIEVQIKRANRFGGDATELELRLKRINKFGISAIRDASAKAEPKLEHRKKINSRPFKKNKKGPKKAVV